MMGGISPSPSPTMKSGIMSFLSDKITLPESLDKLGYSFRTARPYRHIVIDNMFSHKLLDQLVEEIPAMTGDHWVHEDDDHLQKYGLRSAVELGESGYQLTSFL